MKSVLSVEQAKKMLTKHLKIWHNLTLEDVEISSGRGFWKLKKFCDESCKHPIHTFLFNECRMQHTVDFIEWGCRDEMGRFQSPYRAWDTLKRWDESK